MTGWQHSEHEPAGGLKNKFIAFFNLKEGVTTGMEGWKHTLSGKQLSNKVTRLIAKLRAHKLITKIQNTARYRVSHLGAQIISQILLFKKQEMIFKIC